MSDDEKLQAAKEALKKGQKRLDQPTPVAEEKKSFHWQKATSEGASNLLESFGLFGKIAGTASSIWNGYLRPVSKFLNPLFGWLVALYKWIFKRTAYVKEKSGERVYSQKRAGGTIVALDTYSVTVNALV